METTIGFRACLWLAGNEGLEKKMETAIMGHLGTTISIYSSIPSQPSRKSGFLAFG